MITLPPVNGGVGTITSDEQWLLNTYPNLSAPAINFQNRGYRTLHYTLRPEQAIAYFRDENFIIATRPKSGVTNDIRIDLDFGGRYWNLEAIARLREDLENAGLPGSVLCRSSDSDGRWLVVPLPESTPSWQAALTIYSLLTDKGYAIENGHLEISPNVKRWVNRGKEAPKGIKSDWIIDHNAFRLPCQKGFEILDSDGNTVGLGLKDYRHRWEWAKSQQCLDEWQETVAYYAQKENRPKPKYHQRGRGIEAIAKEHAELLAVGFTDASQTNDIGLNLARRSRMLYPGDIQQQAELLKQAFLSMPGYEAHCHHQHEIDRRCQDLARWADKNWSYYGDRLQQPSEEPKPNQNEVRHKNTVDRVTRTLIGWLTNRFTFPSQNQLFEALKRHCRLGKKTFFKYLKELTKFAALVQQLLSAETPTEQALEEIGSSQFTPSSTKRMNCLIEPEVIPLAPRPNLEKKYLISETCSPSSSAPYKLSDTPTNLIPSTQQHSSNQEPSRHSEDLEWLILQASEAMRNQNDRTLFQKLTKRFGVSRLSEAIADANQFAMTSGWNIFKNRYLNHYTYLYPA